MNQTIDRPLNQVLSYFLIKSFYLINILII